MYPPSLRIAGSTSRASLGDEAQILRPTGGPTIVEAFSSLRGNYPRYLARICASDCLGHVRRN